MTTSRPLGFLKKDLSMNEFPYSCLNRLIQFLAILFTKMGFEYGKWIKEQLFKHILKCNTPLNAIILQMNSLIKSNMLLTSQEILFIIKNI